ncbi:hypothetical protein ACN3XK_72730 [Actinomadura welshii]
MSAPIPGPPAYGPPHPPPASRGAAGCFGIVLITAGALLLLAATALGVGGYVKRGEKLNPAYGQALWKEVPADTLFPDTIQQQDDPGTRVGGDEVSWYRVAIAEDVSCEAGLSKGSEEKALQAGCMVAPRATYVDASGNIVATVAHVVLKPAGDPEDQAVRLSETLSDMTNEYGLVHALPAPGTPAADWDDDARNGSYARAAGSRAPYVTAVAVGSVDGRMAARLPAPWNDHSAMEDRLPWVEAGGALAMELSLWLSHLAGHGPEEDE